jgi:molybdopterin-containing oxidoreductase family iron-sulfur binding subunit
MRGVVEKCTFCDERLARGQQPACVEACANGEMVFGDLNDPASEVRELLAEHLTIRRKPGLGTQPEVYYIVEDPRTLQEFAPAAEVFEEEGGYA